MNTLGKLAAGCSDDSSSSAGPGPTATVTVTQTSPPTEEAGASPGLDVLDLSAPPTTYQEGLAHVSVAKDVTRKGADELADFTTPSGNIFCALNLDQLPAGCELRDGTVPAPDVCAGAPTTDVGRVELQGGRAVPVCNTDTIVQPGAPVLEYGQAAYTRDTACVSEEIGVTCVSRSGSGGFFLHRGEYVLLDD